MTRDKLPQHIAIIMDGNGRWAKARQLPRTHGHLEGVKRVEEIVSAARKAGIKILTLYTFSTENWTRPHKEVSMLMRTLLSVLKNKVQQLNRNNIKIQFIGRREGIPETVLKSINSATELTKNNTGMTLNVAFNYGGRGEILDAVKSLVTAVQKGQMAAADINERTFSEALYTKGMTDPDLLIRTSGEKRISNFLLWQLSYAEFYFTDTYWPDFRESEFKKAVAEFQNRERRYGKISAESK